ncbi:PREDICTED: major facilitator superfamily domain-containing protein 3 [Crocodylus porosus]|uniref:major facilitator superfamily domain-containing protein 3 n=1 Tax=Crocodylus porosus TaxID=8502 RepID=UPI00093AF16A|nr:PREDICTED: major facilitator superfamily domain-containing protein 3 [Crocodylus porosus]
MKAKYALLGTLYFVQGLPYGLQSGLLPVYLRSAGLSLTRVSLAKVLYLPWVLKVLWAPCVDRCGALRAWLALSMAGLALACLVCAALSPETDFLPLALALGVMNLLASLQDVAVDGVAVQLLARDEVGHGNAIQVVAYKLGSVLAGGGMLAVLHRVGWRTLFCLLATVYLVAVLYVCKAPVLRLLPRPPSWESQAQAGTLEPRRIVREVLCVPGTPWTAGFVLLYKLGEQGAATMFPLFLLDHGFTPQQLGLWNGIVAVACSILGSSLGGQLMSRQRQPLALLKTLLLLRFCGLSLQTLLLLAYDPHISLLGGKLRPAGSLWEHDRQWAPRQLPCAPQGIVRELWFSWGAWLVGLGEPPSSLPAGFWFPCQTPGPCIRLRAPAANAASLPPPRSESGKGLGQLFWGRELGMVWTSPRGT